MSFVSYSALSHLDCARCDRKWHADVLTNLCDCGSPLLARYQLDSVATTPAGLADRMPSLWRYHELLPVRSADAVVTFGEGMTPLLPLPRLGQRLGLQRLLLKDEGMLPTGSFKARGAAVGVSRALELGARTLSMPTNGNAGAAWAAYAARGGAHISVAMPVDAPSIARSEVAVAGGELTLIRGHIGQAGQWLAREMANRERPVFDVYTLSEPYRIEGKKTMAFEIAEQLGWRMPDVIVYPTGGGAGLSECTRRSSSYASSAGCTETCLGSSVFSPQVVHPLFAPSRRENQSPSRGPIRTQSPSVSRFPKPLVTSWSCVRSTKRTARPSQSTTQSSLPTLL